MRQITTLLSRLSSEARPLNLPRPASVHSVHRTRRNRSKEHSLQVVSSAAVEVCLVKLSSRTINNNNQRQEDVRLSSCFIFNGF